MNITELNNIVAKGAALRRRQRLQPAGGQGDKLFPPTYPGERDNAPPRHVYERRRLNGEDVWCVLIDSVQSQANRLEERLLEVIEAPCDDEKLPIPHVVVDFSEAKLDGITRITSLDAPHRVYDAILRDSLLGNTPFMESAEGQRLAKASAGDASALLEISPTALLFGAWHSTGQGGGLGAKFARCLVSEIMGIDVPVDEAVNQRTGEINARTAGRRTGSRIDPLGILSKVKIYKAQDNPNDWTPREEDAETKETNNEPVLYGGKPGKPGGRPSIINHGNIAPSIEPLGVTCDHAEHTFVLSFAALRRLRFGGSERDAAGRSLLAALGLVALAEQDACGYALRSRCDLVCEDRAPLELVHPDGTTENIEIGREAAHKLYKDAFQDAKAEDAKFNLSAEPLSLKPQEKLVEIVRKSQELALSGEGGEEEKAGGD